MNRLILKSVVICLFFVTLYGIHGCALQTSTETATTTSPTTSSTSSTSTTTTSSTTTTTIVATNALAGTWVGTWEDSYAVTGSLNAVISQTGSTLNGTGSIGLAGLNFFGISTESGTAAGAIAGNAVSFNFNAPTVGSGDGTINGNTVAGTGEVGIFAEGNFIFIGTIEADGRAINAFFDFTGPSAGQGTARIIKQ